MELKLGANVICSDGRQGGKLHFVVLDRTNNTLDDIIVARGFLGAHDMTVQATDIGEISPDGQQIDLKINEDELNNRPEYVVGNLVAPVTGGGGYTADNGIGFGSTFAAAFGAGGIIGSGTIAGGAGGVPSAIQPVATGMSGPNNDMVERQPEGLNIADDAPTIKEAARVSDRYDNTIGSVSALTFNDQMQLTALTVKAGFLFTKETVVSMDWVEDIDDTTVTLKYAKEELPAMQANSGYTPNLQADNNLGQTNIGMADMTSNAYAADTADTTSNSASPDGDTLTNQNDTSTNTANYTTQTSYAASGQDEAPDVVIRDVPAANYSSGNRDSGQSVAMSAYSNTSGGPMSGNSSDSSSMTATKTNSMTDERSNTMSADTNRPTSMGSNETYGNTRSEDGERGDSNSDMDNRSPLSPATNRIADEISGDSSDAFSGSDTRDQGDHDNRAVSEDTFLPPAAGNGLPAGSIAPLIPALNPTNPDGVNNRGV